MPCAPACSGGFSGSGCDGRRIDEAEVEQLIDIDGRCHCGAIRYVASIDPDEVSICHCTDCQSLTGSPFRVTVTVARDAIDITGEPTLYVKRADNGRRRMQYFF